MKASSARSVGCWSARSSSSASSAIRRTRQPGRAYRIGDIDLASRLSFFLWSSIPDDTLLDLAERGQLSTPAVLSREVRRMLADPRADAFVTNFAGQWLFLRNLDAAVPVQSMFPDFDDGLRQAFRRETELFFDSIVREDRSAFDLLRADYTFLNERLAKHYGVPNVKGSHFRRVTLDNGRRAQRAARAGRDSDRDVVSRSHFAGRARQVDPREPARDAAASAAAERAAAATGLLPGQARRVADQAPSATAASAAARGLGKAAVTDLGNATQGLCRAWQAGKGTDNGSRADAPAFQTLAAAAGGSDNIAGYCADVTAGGASDHGQERASAVGPNATAAAREGLCRAWQAGKGSDNGRRTDSVAFQALAAAAGGADKVAGYCADVTAGSAADHGQGQASPPSGSPPSTNISPPSSGPPPDAGPGGHGQGGPPTTTGSP